MKIEEPKAMQEIHEIRKKIWEDIKDLTPQEMAAYNKGFQISSNMKAALNKKTSKF